MLPCVLQEVQRSVSLASLLLLVFADLPSHPATPLLSQLARDLPALTSRTYVSAMAVVKRLLLLQTLADDLKPMVSNDTAQYTTQNNIS